MFFPWTWHMLAVVSVYSAIFVHSIFMRLETFRYLRQKGGCLGLFFCRGLLRKIINGFWWHFKDHWTVAEGFTFKILWESYSVSGVSESGWCNFSMNFSFFWLPQLIRTFTNKMESLVEVFKLLCVLSSFFCVLCSCGLDFALCFGHIVCLLKCWSISPRHQTTEWLLSF